MEYEKEIGELAGEISMCWSETPKGVFDSRNAIKKVGRILTIISTQIEKAKQEGAIEMLELISDNEGWEDSKEHYKLLWELKEENN